MSKAWDKRLNSICENRIKTDNSRSKQQLLLNTRCPQRANRHKCPLHYCFLNRLGVKYKSQKLNHTYMYKVHTESRQKIKHTAQVQIHLPHSQALFHLRHVSDSTKLSSSSSSSSLDLQCKTAFMQVHVEYLFGCVSYTTFSCTNNYCQSHC